MLDIDDLVRESIEVMREHEPEGGYFGCFSGGKDSVLLRHLAERAGVKVRWHYSVTTIDPPELVRFIQRAHSDVTWLRSKHGPMMRRVADRSLMPTRQVRWCCSEYKEVSGPKGAVLLMGIRSEESSVRAARWAHRRWHTGLRRDVVNPILHWPSEELWEYLRCEGVETCSLYREGFARLGCVACPMASRKNRAREMHRWPRFEAAWRRALTLQWERRKDWRRKDGRPWPPTLAFRDADEYWHWWISNRAMPDTRQALLPFE